MVPVNVLSVEESIVLEIANVHTAEISKDVWVNVGAANVIPSIAIIHAVHASTAERMNAMDISAGSVINAVLFLIWIMRTLIHVLVWTADIQNVMEIASLVLSVSSFVQLDSMMDVVPNALSVITGTVPVNVDVINAEIGIVMVDADVLNAIVWIVKGIVSAEIVYAGIVWENVWRMVLKLFVLNVMIQKILIGVVFAENVNRASVKDFVFAENAIVRNVMETAMESSMKSIFRLKMM